MKSGYQYSILIGVILVLSFFYVYQSHSKNEYFLTQKFNCAEIGKKSFDQMVLNFAKSFNRANWWEPEYTYNEDLKTCLIYTHVITHGYKDQEITVDEIRDTLLNKALFHYTHSDIGSKHEVSTCDGYPEASGQHTCVASEQEFQQKKTELFSDS